MPNLALVQAGYYFMLLFYAKPGTGTSRLFFFSVIILHQTRDWYKQVIILCYYFTPNLGLVQAGHYFVTDYFTSNLGLVKAGYYFMLLLYTKPGTGTSRLLFYVIILHQTWD